MRFEIGFLLRRTLAGVCWILTLYQIEYDDEIKSKLKIIMLINFHVPISGRRETTILWRAEKHKGKSIIP